MKNIFSFRFFLWFFAFVLIGGAGLSYYAWKVLTEKINSSGFREEIETTLSNAIEGPVRIGQMECHAGLRPWVSAHNVYLSSQDEKLILKTELVHINVLLKPLFQRHVVLSDILSSHSQLLIRRPKSGAWPEFDRAIAKDYRSAGSLQIKNISIEQARVCFVDEQRSSDPLLCLETDARINNALQSDVRYLAMSGRFEGLGINGRFKAGGQLKPALNLKIRLDHMPLPLTAEATVRGKEGVTATLAWNSTGTSVTAEITAGRGKVSTYAVQIQGNRFDVDEFLESVQRFGQPRSSSASDAITPFSPAAEWSVGLRLHSLLWRGVAMHDVSGRAVWDRFDLQVENIGGHISSGTFSGGAILSKHTREGFQVFSTSAQIHDVEMEPVMFAISSHPIFVSGRLSSDLKLNGLISPWKLESLSGTIRADVQSGYFRTGPVLLEIYSKLNMKSLFKTVSRRRTSGLPFDQIIVVADIKKGRAIFNEPVTFKSSSVEMAYTGWGSCDFKSTQGTLVLNPLLGSRNLIDAIPGVSQLIIGPSGELFPLVVDVIYENGKVESKFKSIQTLTGPALRIIGNVFRIPVSFLRGKKKETQ